MQVDRRCTAFSLDPAVELSYARTDFIEKREMLLEEWAVYCGRQ